MADIVFTSDIKIDTKEAEKSIAHLARQVDAVFSKTSNMMAQAIKTNTFGFSQYTSNYAGGIDELNKILKGQLPKKPGKNASKAALAAYASKMKAATVASNEIRELRHLSEFMQKLSRYDNLYDDIVGLRKAVVGGTIASETGLGRYNVKQRFSNSLLGLLYGYRGMYPGIVTEDALEISEKHRDRNRKTGSQSRSELRYTQDKEYWRKAYDRARNYMLMDSNDTLLNQLNEIYGMGMEPTVKGKPRTVNQKAKDLLTTWAERGMSAQRHKEALDSGNLSKADKAYHLEWYKKDMAAFIKLQQKLFPEEKTIAENLKKLNAADISRWKGVGVGGWIRAGTATGIATKVISDGIQMLESYWGERVSRNVYASKQAYYQRWQTGGQAGGLFGGAAIGGAIGSVVPVIGTAIGAAAGAAIGAIIGPIYGRFKENEVKANMVSTNDMVGRVRNRAMFGSGYNSWFAQGMDNIGVGQGGMAELANNAMSLRAKMMLGQVGEYDMLYYSMMPNYYAALMAGITGPELAKIYHNDLMGISDPSMRYVVGQAIGGQNAFAMANNPYFGAQYSALKYTSGLYEDRTNMMEFGYMRSKADVASQDIGKSYTEIVRTARSKDKDFFNDPNAFVEGQNGNWLRRQGWNILKYTYPGFARFLSPDGKDPVENMLDAEDRKKATNNWTIILTLPDGTELGRASANADEAYMNSWSQYIGG